MASPPKDPERTEGFMAHMRTIGGAFVLAILIRIVLFEAFEIEGPSMQPTLQNGDRVIVAKFLYGLFLPFTEDSVLNWGSPEAGNVIILRSPERGVETVDIVKRVIGEPGDEVEVRMMPVDCGNGLWSEKAVIIRNGEQVPQEVVGACTPEDTPMPPIPGSQCNCQVIRETINGHDYFTSNSFTHSGGIAPSDPTQPYRRIGPVVLDDSHVFVMGDHRDRSNDSRNPQLGPVPLSRIKGRALMMYWSNSDESGIRWDRVGSAVQ